MKNDLSHRKTRPFVMYQNGLEMFGRVVESSCRMSLQFVEAMNRAASAASEEEPTPVKEAISSTMIPSTGDVENAAAAVAAAMNQSAIHKLGTYADKDEPRESMKETVARTKSSISAAKPRGKN